MRGASSTETMVKVVNFRNKPRSNELLGWKIEKESGSLVDRTRLLSMEKPVKSFGEASEKLTFIEMVRK